MQALIALISVFAGLALVGSILIYLRVRKLEAKTQSVGKGQLREQDVREIVKNTVAANGDVTAEDLAPIRAGVAECQTNIRKIADAFNNHILQHQAAAARPAGAALTPDEDTSGEADDTVSDLPTNGGGGGSSTEMRRPIVSPASPPSVPTPGVAASPASRRRSARIRSQDDTA
jgi:hypothetical protein